MVSDHYVISRVVRCGTYSMYSYKNSKLFHGLIHRFRESTHTGSPYIPFIHSNITRAIVRSPLFRMVVDYGNRAKAHLTTIL